LITLAACVLSQPVDPRNRSVLFIRGADCTGGATEGGECPARTEQLSDVENAATNPGNHGYAWLRAVLQTEGLFIAQLVESATPLTLPQLLPHRAVVLGSNNKVYAPAEVQALHDYVDAGGSVLFISDANWGLLYGAAPMSDNQFLARYGVEVYQDSGHIPVMWRAEPGRYLLPEHPILSGPDGSGGGRDVGNYDGEGVSFFRLIPGTAATSVVDALGFVVRLNTGDGSPGPSQPAAPGDTALFSLERGDARLIGHYDRNTFFNLNGAGTDISRRDNAVLARNLFRFLVSVPATSRRVPPSCGTGAVFDATPPALGRTQTISLWNAAPSAMGLLVIGLGPASPAPLPGGCVLQVPLTSLATFPAPVTDPAGWWSFPITWPDDLALSGITVTAQVLTFVSGGPLGGTAELSNAVEMRLGFSQ
jgi:hypothetical protein